MAQGIDRKGRIAVGLVVDAIDRSLRGHPVEPRRELLATELVVRASTGPPSTRR
ncbi:hypothetical protein [Pseudonocardia sp. NPDC049635]|uniref:hypothetical protein n=1 Tax=Pseudonocardia sp. NPDC049635 TaxID=3155506 RepID=UPI0033EDEA42